MRAIDRGGREGGGSAEEEEEEEGGHLTLCSRVALVIFRNACKHFRARGAFSVD